MNTLFKASAWSICLLVAATGFAQTVRIADNNFNAPTGANIFSTIQEAVDAADPGDYIYIQPSPTTYGSVDIEKEVHLVGIGFSLTKDQPHLSRMTDIILKNNVDNTSDASNTTITGLVIDEIIPRRYTIGGAIFTLDNVKIYNCQMASITWLSSSNYTVPITNMEVYDNRVTSQLNFNRELSNTIIRNNLIQGTIDMGSSNPQTVVISNNIIYGRIDKGSQGDNVIIQNNNFVGAKGSDYAFQTMMLDAIVANNIFYGRTPSVSAAGGSTSTNFQRNIFTNNISYETGNDELPPSGGSVGNSGDGNLTGVSPMFTNVPILGSWSSAYDFTLQAGSPALDAGSDGTDIGITGGPYTFVGSNLVLDTTPLPTIEIFNTSTVINPGDDLDVRVKAKSN